MERGCYFHHDGPCPEPGNLGPVYVDEEPIRGEIAVELMLTQAELAKARAATPPPRQISEAQLWGGPDSDATGWK